MVDVYVGQEGRAVVKMVDAQGRPTTNYDVEGGIEWTSSNDELVSVDDDDADPTDATFTFHRATAAGENPVRVSVNFDGRSGPDENRVTLQSDEITVLEPPPGEAVGGTVDIELTPVS